MFQTELGLVRGESEFFFNAVFRPFVDVVTYYSYQPFLDVSHPLPTLIDFFSGHCQNKTVWSPRLRPLQANGIAHNIYILNIMINLLL